MPSAVSRALGYAQDAVRSAPWIHLAVLPPALSAAIGYAASSTPAEQAAAWGLVTVAGTLAAGLLRRPVHVAVSSAAVTVVAGDLAALGFHLPPSALAGVLALVSLVSPAASQVAPGQRAASPPEPGDVPAPRFPAGR